MHRAISRRPDEPLKPLKPKNLNPTSSYNSPPNPLVSDIFGTHSPGRLHLDHPCFEGLYSWLGVWDFVALMKTYEFTVCAFGLWGQFLKGFGSMPEREALVGGAAAVFGLALRTDAGVGFIAVLDHQARAMVLDFLA